MLIALKTIHFMSLAAGIGIGISSMILGIRAARSEGAAIGALRSAQGVLGRVALGAIILLWITGIWMWQAYHGGATSLSFTAKIVFVVVLTALSSTMTVKGIIFARGGRPIDPIFAKRMGMAMGLMGILAVTTAVIAFT